MRRYNRILTRMLGVGLAAVGVIWGQSGNAAVETVSGTVGHAKYTGTYNSVSVNGFFVHVNAWWGTISSAGSGGLEYGGYNYSNCINGGAVDGTGSGSTTGTSGSSSSSVEDSLPCAWYKCVYGSTDGMGGYNVSGCSTGKCDTTGIYCSNSGFFTNYGYAGNMQTTSWAGMPTSGMYKFVGCETGWYITSTGAPCTSGQSSYTNMSGCCKACPGYSFDSGIGTTWNNTGDSNCASGWCWTTSGNGVGITSCYTYPNPSNQIFKDNFGEYIFAGSGCPYQN
ncbi:MAG: hypothetical protein NC311_05255 [Muribaculaceae bacterium]|nr:hypothetical protein [Muribaculaceae bacterium]